MQRVSQKNDGMEKRALPNQPWFTGKTACGLSTAAADSSYSLASSQLASESLSGSLSRSSPSPPRPLSSSSRSDDSVARRELVSSRCTPMLIRCASSRNRSGKGTPPPPPPPSGSSTVNVDRTAFTISLCKKSTGISGLKLYHLNYSVGR